MAMPKIPDAVTNGVIHFATETGSEVVAELFADFVLGRRGKEDPERVKLLDLLKNNDKEEAFKLIKANQQGIGLGDEQILDNDFMFNLGTGMLTLTESDALAEFFFTEPVAVDCLTERERSIYRRAHILETDDHIRRRNLRTLAQMPDHATRRRHLGASGKLDPSLSQKAYDYVFEERTTDPAGVVRIADLKADTAVKKARVLGTTNRTGLWHWFKTKIRYERI